MFCATSQTERQCRSGHPLEAASLAIEEALLAQPLSVGSGWVGGHNCVVP